MAEKPTAGRGGESAIGKESHPTPRRSRSQVAFALLSILAGVALIVAIPAFRHAVTLALRGDFAGLRRDFRGLGAGGVTLMFGLALAHAVIFYPTEIVTATAGFVYGFAGGASLAIAGWIVSGLVAYWLGRVLARRLLMAVFGERRFGGLERTFARGGIPLLLSARLIPVVPFSLVCYVMGASKVRLWRFTWTTAIGYLPLTVAVAYLGSRARTLSLSDPVVLAIAATAIVLLGAAHFLGVRGRFRETG